VENHDALSALGKKNRITVTPKIIINGCKVAVGKVLTEGQIVEIVHAVLRRNQIVSSG